MAMTYGGKLNVNIPSTYILDKDELQEWTGHSTLISENLELVEISKNT